MAGLGFLLVLVFGLFVWRISVEPLDIGFAKLYIQEKLENKERGTRTTFDSVVLHWPNLAGPLLLDIKGAKVFGADGHLMIGIDEASLSLSKASLLIGQIAPVGLIVKNPELKLVRNRDGKLDIGFGGMGDPAAEEAKKDFAERILQYIEQPGQNDASPLATLKELQIIGATVNIDDQSTEVTWFLPRVDIVVKSVGAGLNTKIYVEVPAEGEGISTLRADFLIPWDHKDLQIGATLENFDLRMIADKIPMMAEFGQQQVVFSGRLDAIVDANFKPQIVQASLASPEGTIMHPALSDKPIPYKDLAFKATYDSESGKLDVAGTQVTLSETPILASGNLVVDPQKIFGLLKVSIDTIKQEKIGQLWPVSLKDENAKEWIVDKMSEGTFHNVFAEVNLLLQKGEQGWVLDAHDVHAGFAFEGMAVNYRPPMTPVKNAKGSGTFNLQEEKLDVIIESGQIADLNVTDARLEFVHIIESGKGMADLHMNVEGPLKSGFEYLEKEPIALKHKFDLAKVKGDAKATINVSFPTKDVHVKDVKVGAKGTLSQVYLPGVLKSIDMTGGPLDFTIKDNQFNLKGGASLAGRPAKIEYMEFLSSEGQAYKAKINASLNADPNIRMLMGIDLSEFIEGSAPVDVAYTEYTDGKSEAVVKVDLKPAFVFFKPFDYEKPMGVEGSATLNAHLQNGILTNITNLNAEAAGMKISNAQFGFREKDDKTMLASGQSSSFSIGETVGNLDFTVEASGRYNIKMNGTFLDLRPFIDNEEGQPKEVYDNPAILVSVNVDRMRTDDKEVVQKARLVADVDGEGRFNQLEMDAGVGKGNLTVRYMPNDQGMRVFSLTADDAGATLRAFGVYDKIVGGKLNIYGEPIKGYNDRNIVGVAEITDFKVVNAPTLARLLSITSLPGLISMLNNEGLSFTKLEAKFDWLYRKKGSLLVLKDGRTSGNSVGFTFDGTFNKSAATMDFSGTIIPLSGMNKVIGSIPLVGDILTGGDGGVFAATYSIKGSSENPQVFVNPLSVLTPGILRRILFEQN